uniref:ABC transporter permease DevC n=1 Tax=Stappia sp. TaxID=1870903 RepID=UPI003BAA75AE
MTALLSRLLGRLPIGWLQLTHNRGRLAAALAGVAFANILVFMQLGFLGALIESIRLPYKALHADVLVSASDANTLFDGSPLPRNRLYQALSVSGVEAAESVYYGRIDWKQPDGTLRTMDVFGVDPSGQAFSDPELQAKLPVLALPDRALMDRKTRNAPAGLFPAIDAGSTYDFETRGRTLTVVDTFTIGGGFAADGYIVVSDQTFLRLFPARLPGAPNYILLRLSPEASRARVLEDLRATLPASDTSVRAPEEAMADDQRFQTTQKPVGVVFGFGVVIGCLVGVIIVYQVLSTDVADHIREYATFKAIGYGRGFFLGIVFEEAFILAFLGFVPGTLISTGLYALVQAGTGLPIWMTQTRPLIVFAGTLVMCAASGAIATRRLARAEPAELF